MKSVKNLRSLIAEVIASDERIEGKDDIVGIYLQAMLYRAVHLSESVCDLNDKNRGEFSCVMARSLIEVYVDFILLTKDPRYLLHLNHESEKGKSSVITGLISMGYSIPLVDRKYKPQTGLNFISKKFELAGVSDLYTIYRLFCADSHNSIASLRRSYIDYDKPEIVGLHIKLDSNLGKVAVSQSYKTLYSMHKILVGYIQFSSDLAN